ncbi:MAG: LapA family protein [Pelagimonas sp.]|jgi:uncharacterized integral membrane protein|nr:LapA family protein [Pelagimonas sp.]
MRYIRYAFLAALALVLIVGALANRDMVELNTLPAVLDTAPVLGAFAFSIQVPLFVVIFASLMAGAALGFAWEWLREHKFRAEANRKTGEVRKLERELKKTQNERDKDKDEVLAILDQAS